MKLMEFIVALKPSVVEGLHNPNGDEEFNQEMSITLMMMWDKRVV